MNPAELAALRARFPELQGMGEASVADAFNKPSASPQPTDRQQQEQALKAAARRALAAGDEAAAKRLVDAARAVAGAPTTSAPTASENPFRQFAPEPNPFAKFAPTGGQTFQHNGKTVTAVDLLRAAKNAHEAGDTEAAERLVQAANSLMQPPADVAEGQIANRWQTAPLVSDGAAPSNRWESAPVVNNGTGTGGIFRRGDIQPVTIAAVPPRADEPTPATPKVERFGDTIGDATEAPIAATKAFAGGLWDQSRSPTMAALPDSVPNALRGPIAGVGDFGGMVLSGLGTALAGGAGLVGEVVGGTRTEERQLARDLMMGMEVAVPELAGVSGTVRAGGAAVRAVDNLNTPAKPGQVAARAAGDLGITPSAGMSGKTTAMVAAGLEKVPFAGDVIARDAARAVAEVEGVFARIRNGIGNAANVAGAGDILQSGLGSFVEGFKRTSGKLFDVVDQRIPADRRFALNATASRIQEAKAVFAGNPELAQRLGLNNWDAIVAEAQANGVTWPAIKQFRSSIGEAIGNLEGGKQGGSLSSENISRLKALYGALTQDMEAAARSAGDGAYTAWTRANNYYRSGAQRIERSLDQTIRADNPERAFMAFQNLLSEGRTSSDITRVRQIKASLKPDEWNDIAASIVDRLGRPSAGQQNAAGDAFSPSAFLNNWNKMDPDARRLLLPEDARIELEKLAAVAQRVKAGNAERNTSNTGTAGWVATLFLGGVTDIGTTAAVLGVTNLSARALTSTTFLKAMNAAARGDVRTMRAIANGNGPFRTDARTILRLAAADAASPQPQTEGNRLLNVTGPDGRRFTVTVRAGASQDEIAAAIRAAAKR